MKILSSYFDSSALVLWIKISQVSFWPAGTIFEIIYIFHLNGCLLQMSVYFLFIFCLSS